MAALWPQVVNRLVVLLPTLPGWTGVQVYDGDPVTSAKPNRYVTVGFVDGETEAGTYTQETSPVGIRNIAEAGEVRCHLVAQTGAVDQPGMRAQAFALVDALEASMRDDPLLGVLPTASTSSLAVTVEPIQNGKGSAVALVLTVSYTATSFV